MNCTKCNDTGLLPYRIQDGTVSKHAKIFCDCHPIYGTAAHEYSYPIKPGDFDFPISYDFYRSLCQYYGWDDPGSDYPPEQINPPEQEIIHRHINYQRNMSKKEYDLLQQTALKTNYLLKKLNEKKPYVKKYNTYE